MALYKKKKSIKRVGTTHRLKEYEAWNADVKKHENNYFC